MVLDWSKKHLGQDFKFRENQLEVISKLIDDKINNKIPHHIIQAPTGSGKSLINVISAGVLWEYFNRKSYILASDLYLYQQYVDLIDNYNLKDFAYLKGHTGNYSCPKASGDMRQSVCKMAGLSYDKLFNIIDKNLSDIKDLKTKKLYKNFQCAKSCQYLLERREACESPITLMTYHLFYFQMNICKIKFDTHGRPLPGQFIYRDYIFCDECHNIPNIIQSRCKPSIKFEDFSRMLKIFNYYKSIKKDPSKIKIFQYIDENKISTLFKDYWNQMLDKSLDSYHNTILLLNYTHKLVDKVCIIGERIQRMFGTKVKKGLTLSDKEKDIYSDITWIQNYHCYLDDFCRAIELGGYHHTYKQICLGNVINFGCVKEDGVIYSFLTRWAIEGTTLCSATIGNIEAFIENCGFKHFENNITKIDATGEFLPIPTSWNPNSKVKFFDLPSNFDFSKSPIYLDFEHKLNYSNKSKNIIPITNKINKILNNHKKQNGIIQTGSYEIAKLIYKYLNTSNKRRALVYSNSQEKHKFIKMVNKNSNYILIGPSLNEGIDLPGNLCDFVIISKVPFLSLGDKYVSTKMKLFKKWYNDTTMNNLIQGIGRGNRFKNDKCQIYILDGCFKRLYSYTKKFWPEYITNRFINLNINELYGGDKISA